MLTRVYYDFEAKHKFAFLFLPLKSDDYLPPQTEDDDTANSDFQPNAVLHLHVGIRWKDIVTKIEPIVSEINSIRLLDLLEQPYRREVCRRSSS